MIGKTISHYKVIEKIGEGGMGVVYKAEDLKLKRPVALKFFTPRSLGNPDEKTRFLYEAQAAAALDHPNICTTYEIDEGEGRTFIAMAYVEGRTLKEMLESGPLAIEKALDIITQVAEGLQAAHDKGIIHRDIKGDNIMVTEKGQAKIMDFGLAKLPGRTQLTTANTIMGTVEYMSPEQARGEVVDHRADIWSLGIVLYEALTGRPPFIATNPASLIHKIIHEEPAEIADISPHVPTGLSAVVARALAKDREERYESVLEFLDDLRNYQTIRPRPRTESGARRQSGTVVMSKPGSKRSRFVAVVIAAVVLGLLTAVVLLGRKSKLPYRLFTAPAQGKALSSIVVLPFVDMSPGKDQEYFCDGLAEEIINALSQVKGLRVVARTSAFSFKGEMIDVRDIGKKLGVDAVLEGSVRKAGNKLRITAQLVSVADGYHLWSERYDRDMAGVFAVQDEITVAIVDNLQIKLLGEERERLARQQGTGFDAYNSYLQGRYFWNKMTEEGLKKAIEYFEQAIEKAPDYAPAYAGLADSYMNLPLYSAFSPQEAYTRAKQAVTKALELDDTLAEAHASHAWIKMNYEWDWKGAESECLRAIELNPGYAAAHRWYAFDLLFVGRFDQSVKEVLLAQELDPLSLVANRTVGHIYYYAGQYEKALQAIRKTMEMDPNFAYVHLDQGLVYLQQSKNEQALAEFQKEKALAKTWNPVVETWLAIGYAKAGKKDEAQKALNDLIERSKKGYVPPSGIARLYIVLGEKEPALEWLTKAFQKRDFFLRYLKVEPTFDPIRSDPRCTEMLRKMGLET
ncbi:protein kinase [Candidatus Poribacteria bacterium]|nr:protein kinase [Candidatus Poribacteria bacterium]